MLITITIKNIRWERFLTFHLLVPIRYVFFQLQANYSTQIMAENRLARGRLDCNCLSLGVVKLVGKNWFSCLKTENRLTRGRLDYNCLSLVGAQFDKKLFSIVWIIKPFIYQRVSI